MTIAGVVFSGILLWLAIKDTSIRDITSSFKNARPVFAVPILISLASFYYLKAVRWSDILSPTLRLAGHKLVPAIMAGAAGNNLLPAHMGELVRVYLLSRQFELSKSHLLATLVVERVLDVVGVLLLLSVTLIFIDSPSTLTPAIVFLLIVAVGGSVVMYFMTIHGARIQVFAERHSKRLPTSMRQKIVSVAEHLSRGFGALRTRALFYRIFVNSVAQWALMAACIYFALLALGTGVPFYAAIIVLAIVVAGLTLPTSPGFVGTIQFCFVLGLSPFGVDSNEAIAASIFYHSILWFSVTSVGMYFLHRYHLTFAQVKKLQSDGTEVAVGRSEQNL